MATNVLITGALHATAVSAFESDSSLNVSYSPDLKREKLLSAVTPMQVLVTRSETTVDRELIDAAPELKVIARAAVGVGNIDLDYATEKGILVINCPGKNTNSAAELTLGLLLGLFRNVPDAHGHLKSGGWDRHRFAGIELRGKSIGIVGLGNVGHRVAKFANGFDMDVWAYDPYIAPEVFQRNGAQMAESLAELAAKVDILSVHVPMNNETKEFINADVFSKMRPGTYFVNAARGGVMREADVLAALNSGHLAGAAIDTFQNEPAPMPDLIAHPKLCCTPHIGASTIEAQKAIGATVYKQVTKALAGGVVDYPVNLPEVGVPDNPALKAYSVLAEKLGALIAQTLDFNPQSIAVNYRGRLADMDTSLVRLSIMKGYAGHIVEDYVSFVNAGAHFQKLGIALEEKNDPAFKSYKSAIKINITGPSGQKLSVGGTVFDEQHPKISLINDYYFEIDPRGSLLILENHDRPGVVGDVGQFLAKEGINIDTFALSRNNQGERAMAVIRVDESVAPASLSAMQDITNVVSVKSVHL